MATLHALAREQARARVESLRDHAECLAAQLRGLEDEIRENHADLTRALAALAALDLSGHDEPPAGSMS